MNNTDNEFRLCSRFNMSSEEFIAYKKGKVTRIYWFILAIVFVSIFKERILCYVNLTLLLVGSYWYNAICEKQWIKDGSVKKEDLW